MPIGGIAGFEGPIDGCGGEAVLDIGIFGQILGIVIVIELEVPDGPIESKGNEREEQADLPGGRSRLCSRNRLGSFTHALFYQVARRESLENWEWATARFCDREKIDINPG